MIKLVAGFLQGLVDGMLQEESARTVHVHIENVHVTSAIGMEISAIVTAVEDQLAQKNAKSKLFSRSPK